MIMEKNVKKLSAMLKSKDAKKSASASEKLRILDDTLACPVALDALKHMSGHVKVHAISILAFFNCPGSTEPLCRVLLKDNSFIVRQQAAWALGVMGDKAAEDSLIKALKDTDWEVLKSVIESLVALDSKKALPALNKLLETNDETVKSNALWAIKRLGG
jgi:HEAT repeat protein